MPNSLKQQASVPGVALIKQFEGFMPQAYPDPLHGWKVATIGYGTTVYASGQRVKQGDLLNAEQAQAELEHFILKQLHPALNHIPGISDMNDHMLGALESFGYNLGPGFYGSAYFQTISRVLRERQWEQFRSAVLLYVNPGTAVEVGLRRRRNAEADLWEHGLQALRQT